jgi:hypothetical protein
LCSGFNREIGYASPAWFKITFTSRLDCDAAGSRESVRVSPSMPYSDHANQIARIVMMLFDDGLPDEDMIAA